MDLGGCAPLIQLHPPGWRAKLLHTLDFLWHGSIAICEIDAKQVSSHHKTIPIPLLSCQWAKYCVRNLADFYTIKPRVADCLIFFLREVEAGTKGNTIHDHTRKLKRYCFTIFGMP